MDDVGAVRGRLWRAGELVEEKFDFEQISTHLKDGTCLIWVDLCGPGEQLLNKLAGELSLDPQVLQSLFHSECLQRCAMCWPGWADSVTFRDDRPGRTTLM